MENFEKRAGAVEKLLQDEESKMVFRFRNQYSLTNDKRYLLDLIYESCKKYGRRYKTNMDLVRFIQKILSVGKADVCIFGAGGAGNVVVQLLYEYGLIENENINVYFADNNKELQGKERKHHNPAMRLMIKRPEEIPSTAFVIAAQYDHLHAVEVYNQCRKLGIDEGNIFFPEWLYEYQIGDIYFSKEIYKLGENETFYDIGSYDLENTRQFINAAGTYKEIYALEADAVSFNKCEQIAEKNMWSNIHLINAAAWSSNTQLRFESAPNGEFGGSKVNIQGGAQTVEALKIDDIGGHPTLIKMDIEGAEEDALEGARCTILDRKPKLTFSIYHRPFDPIILTEKVLSIRSDYKFYMRHHTMGIWDTVLYAI